MWCDLERCGPPWGEMCHPCVGTAPNPTVLSPKGVGVEASPRVSLRSLVQSLQTSVRVVRAEKALFLKTILQYVRRP
jgi:hypothetical protein